MISVTTPPHGLARLHAGLVSPHGHACPPTVSPPSLSAPDPSLSAPDQPSLSTPDPSPSASDPSLSAQDHSISAPSLPCNCQPVVLLRWSSLLRDCSWASDVRRRSIGGQGDYFLVLTLHTSPADITSYQFPQPSSTDLRWGAVTCRPQQAWAGPATGCCSRPSTGVGGASAAALTCLERRGREQRRCAAALLLPQQAL